MNLKDFLWWKGRSNLDEVLAHFPKPIAELSKLLSAGEISVHRESLGGLWIRCPAYVKKNVVLELIEEQPGITATEAMEQLKLNRRDFYSQLAQVKVEKVKEGRVVRLYASEEDTPGTPPAEGHSDHQEPAKASWRPSEVPAMQWEMYKEALGELKSDWKERVADHGYSLLDDDRKAFVDEVDKYDLDFVMKDMGMNMKEATKFMAHLELWKLARVYRDDGIAKIYEVTYGGE